MPRRVALLCLIILSLFIVLPASAQGPIPPLDKDAEAKIAPGLRATLAKEGRAEFLVVLQEQADLSGAYALSDRASKARFVYHRLRETAQRTQPSVMADLTAQGGAIQRFALVNALLVSGDTRLVERLAGRSDVKRLEPNTAAPGVQSVPDAPVQQGVGTTWGVTRVKAPQVWSEYTRGAGVVVGVADTGVFWTHPALQSKYRGWDGTTADHTYSWHDAIENSPVPVQVHSHGTHVVGTMIGEHVTDTTTNRIGVAPDARWIGCRNMAGPSGIGTPARYLDCMEFMLAPFPPTGTFIDDGRPDLGADIINNSWGCPTDEGCYPHTLTQTIAVLQAAGIMFVSSAGNNGSTCSTVIDPPGLTAETFAVGAFTEGGNIASFSSRGPVTVDNSLRPKPDIAAPGTNVLSSIPGGGYGSSQGTSMASPHVAGVAALVWSAVPALKGHVAVTEALLRATAVQRNDSQCGTVAGGRANHVWGWGEVDALAAVQAALATGEISGTVTSAATGQPLANAQVNLVGPGALNLTLTTNASGQYSVRAGAGDYTITASSLGYTPLSASVPLGTNGSLTQNFSLTSVQEFTLSGYVRQTGNAAPIRATVEIVGSSRRAITDAAGFYSLTLPAGDHTLRAKAMGYKGATGVVTVASTANHDFSLSLAAPILIVDDDEGKDLETVYTATLTGLNRVYDIYEVRDTGVGPTAELLENYCLIIWIVGGPLHRIRAADYAALKTYLDHGGRLMLSEPGGASSDFHRHYLRAERATGSTALTLTGTGDFSGSFGYFNDSRADTAAPLTALAGGTPAFAWAGQPTYGAVAYTEIYKTLYLSFGLHNIGVSSRASFMTQALTWFACPTCQIPGDIDFNGQVNVIDIILVTQALNQTAGQPTYRYRLDRNLDQVIDTTDMHAVAAHWSARCSS